MGSKTEAIQQIELLMKTHSIRLAELREQVPLDVIARSDNQLKKYFAYLGGIFIFCGLGVFLNQHWDKLNTLARILVTLGSGIVIYILAVFASFNTRYIKTLTPLFLLAALFETSGMFVAIDELFHTNTDPRYAALFIFTIMFLQQILTFSMIKRTALLFTTLFFGYAAVSVAYDLLHANNDYVTVIIGASMLLLATNFTKSEHHTITPVGFLLGSIFFLVGSFEILVDTNIELLYLAISMFFIYLSTRVASKMILICGTIALISYIGYFTHQHFVNSIGWPLALILFGFLMLGVSAFAVNIGKSIGGSGK